MANCEMCISNCSCKSHPMTINCDRFTKIDYRTSQDVIIFHGQILDGYNGHTASVVIVDIGTEFRIYHAHGYYTTPITPSWLIS